MTIITGVIWLTAHVLMAPTLIAIHSQQFRRTGLRGGLGIFLAVCGTLGMSAAVFLIFPELIGLKTDTVDTGRRVLALQALAELSIVSLLCGLILLGVAVIQSGRFPRLPGLFFIAGALVAPLVIVDVAMLVLTGTLVGAGLVWLGTVLALEKHPASLKATNRRHPDGERTGIIQPLS